MAEPVVSRSEQRPGGFRGMLADMRERREHRRAIRAARIAHLRALVVHRVFKDNKVAIRLRANAFNFRGTWALGGVQDTVETVEVGPSLAAVRDSLRSTSVLDEAAREVGDGNSLTETVTIALVASLCRLFMNRLNNTHVVGLDKIHDAILRRQPGQALITVSNHVASMDDPLVTAALLPPEALTDARHVRWTLCATDRCFTNKMFASFFRAGKVLPVERGAGLEQDGMRWAIGRLRQGDWVHIFPEGQRSRNGGEQLSAMRRGVGRLVSDLDTPPLIIPFVHAGMHAIIPVGSSIPSAGNKVSVLIGEPVDVSDLLSLYKDRQMRPRELFAAVTDRVGQALTELHAEVKVVHAQGVAALEAFREEKRRIQAEGALAGAAGTGAHGHAGGPGSLEDSSEEDESLYDIFPVSVPVAGERNRMRSMWRLAAMAAPHWMQLLPGHLHHTHGQNKPMDAGRRPPTSSSTSLSSLSAPSSSSTGAGSTALSLDGSGEYEGLLETRDGEVGLWHSTHGGLGSGSGSHDGAGAGMPRLMASAAVARMREGARRGLQRMRGFAAAGAMGYDRHARTGAESLWA
eukprot:jgi/Mesvir1/26938/Mv20659-RA.1